MHWPTHPNNLGFARQEARGCSRRLVANKLMTKLRDSSAARLGLCASHVKHKAYYFQFTISFGLVNRSSPGIPQALAIVSEGSAASSSTRSRSASSWGVSKSQFHRLRASYCGLAQLLGNMTGDPRAAGARAIHSGPHRLGSLRANYSRQIRRPPTAWWPVNSRGDSNSRRTAPPCAAGRCAMIAPCPQVLKPNAPACAAGSARALVNSGRWTPPLTPSYLAAIPNGT